MKCVEIDLLQELIDGELEIGLKKVVEKHLSACSKCSNLYDELKANDDFAFSKLNTYKQFYDEHFEPKAANFGTKKIKNKNHATVKGVSHFMLKYKKAIAAACLAVAVTTCVTVQPVRAAISNALSIFRVENVKGIKISLDDIQQIQRRLAANDPEINMDKLGKIKTQGGQRRNISIEEAKALTDFKVLLPDTGSGINPSIYTIDSAAADFTLNVANTNDVLKTFGAKKLLPKSLDGKTFTINTSRIIYMNYNNAGKNFNITQMKSPQITVPDGVNLDEIYDAITDLPILPENLQKQLKSIKDWKNTLYIPVVDSQMEEIQINGSTGYVQSSAAPQQKGTFTSLVWLNNGVIYSIQGNLEKDAAVNIAKSMH